MFVSLIMMRDNVCVCVILQTLRTKFAFSNNWIIFFKLNNSNNY